MHGSSRTCTHAHTPTRPPDPKPSPHHPPPANPPSTPTRAEKYLARAVCGVRFEAAVPYREADTNACPGGAYTKPGFTKYTVADNGELGHARALMVNPVAISVVAGFNNFQAYSSGVWPCSTSANDIDHAIVLTGYTKGVKMNGGAVWNVFRAKNSWGSGWGQGGFVDMRADCTGAGTLHMYDYPGVLPMRQG